MLRSLLASAAIAGSLGIGSLAMMATPASASVIDHTPPTAQSWGDNGNMCPQENNWSSDKGNCGCQNTWTKGGRDVQPWENTCRVCRPVTITFDFAPNPNTPPGTKGTWLLETGGPALHDNETLTYHGATWRVENWNPDGNGSLGNHKPYFTLSLGNMELSGSLSENPQTAWLTQEICTTSVNPCPCNTDPCGHNWNGTLENFTPGRGNLCDVQIPQPCKPVIRDPKPCTPVTFGDPKNPCRDGGFPHISL